LSYATYPDFLEVREAHGASPGAGSTENPKTLCLGLREDARVCDDITVSDLFELRHYLEATLKLPYYVHTQNKCKHLAPIGRNLEQ
jgi:hypothetical protein